jgi:hypothetical protein
MKIIQAVPYLRTREKEKIRGKSTMKIIAIPYAIVTIRTSKRKIG